MNTSTPKQPSRRRLKILRDFWPYARPYSGRIALALLILFVDTLVSLAEPWPVKLIFDNVLLGKHLHSPWSLLIPESVAQDPVLLLVILCGALLLLAVVSAGATYFSTRLLALAGQRIIFRLRCALFAHLQQLSPAFYDRQRLGDLLTRLTSDVLAIQDMLVVALPMLLLSGMTIVGMIAILVLINPIFGVLGVVIAFALYLVLRKYLGNIKRVARQTRHQEGDANAVAQENLLGIRVVQAFGMEKHARQRYEESITEALQLGEVAADLESSMPSMVSLVTDIGMMLVLGVGGILALQAWKLKHGTLPDTLVGGSFVLGDIRQPGPEYTDRFLNAIAGWKKPVFLELFDAAPREFFQKVSKCLPNWTLEISMESHDEQVRRAFGRPYSDKDIEATMEYALEYGVQRLDLFFMVGLKQQTFESVMGTVEYSRRLLQRHAASGEKRVIPFISPLAPFVDPGSAAFENPAKHGYRLFARTLEEHRQRLLAPSWKYVLNYETEWMNRDQIAEATYEAGRRMNLVKGEYGVIDPNVADATDRRIARARALMAEIDRIITLDPEPHSRSRKLRELKSSVDSANLSTVCDKRELEVSMRGQRINMLQAAAMVVGDWWKDKVKN